ncbi:hypothetical protein FBU59_001616 [Linderina macrospora]|uniref:Uncharacterized protein n=1 Tax=Linderina macrospora TaxID=4868 RepID=A0ACC1JDC2_9FUNG|nr:hypothetical protein FBU59_001616 [Linderina macrospora]
MSPGRNDYKVFQSHHGVGSASDSSNPFDSAFGFSEAEVWNLVCNHVEQHAFGKTLTYQTQLKKELVAYMFKNIDWSTYGTKQYCFNTRSVMRFLESIEGYDSLVQIQGSILDHQMRLRETLDTNTLHITEPYRFKHLIEGPMLEFLTRREFHFGNPSTMGTLEAEFRAQGIEFLSHSAFRDVPFKVHDEALTCMVPMCLSVDQSRIMECSPRGLCLESTFCQLYQAGYLALINGHVCITNNESFEALLAILHSRCPNPGHSIWTLSPALYDTGIHNGDLIKFARFMDNHLRSRAEFPLTHPIETYMCFISALLTPLRYQGCTVHMEPKPADGGMLDIIIMRDVPIDPHADPVQEQRKLPQIVIKVQMPIQPEFIKPNYEIPVDHRKNAFNQAVKTSKSILMAMRMRRLNFQPPGVPLHTFITLSFMYNRFFLCATRYIGNSGQPMTSSWKAYPYDENDTRGVTSSRIGYNIHKGHLIASTFLS